MDILKGTMAELAALRRRLHASPELSGREWETARLVAGELRRLHPDLLLENLGGTGVAAVFNGGGYGPAVLFRAELDALPIGELNDFEWRSNQDHVSHKCGHDGHMAILLGLARIVAQRRPARGRVILLFQPAEETGEGAAAVLNDRRFAEIAPDWVFALHNLPGYPAGSVICKEGPFTAGVQSLIIRLRGKASHAAEPEFGINPAQALADLLRLPETLAQADPERPDFALVTPVYAVMGEKAYGVSAGYGELHLTIRCWTREKMEVLASSLLRKTAETAAGCGLELETEWTNVFHANCNHPQAVNVVRKSAGRLGLQQIECRQALKFGEDFGAFTQRFRGAMFGLGAGENTAALHNPDYDFPDELLYSGVRLFYEIALETLGSNEV